MRTLAFAIAVVGVATVALIWGSLHVIHDAEKMQRNPRLLRRRFLTMGIIYALSSGWGIVQVASGDLPAASLIGVAVAASLAWLLIKQSSGLKSGQ
jgi:tryptophan-rich sensory protein